ncbi:polysaccharide deacetylase [Winogradskyella pacifica]|uniref:Polysaccharide deacetylase n=1 Tax=Winogradskyella pacifica TaxID=664642 RepID=A0A3D9MZY8_9FLAO|nr:polysaccharide deacetylase family protein [Winogradskyella pacifica]REE25782.1 polysaccharide deacetylase [Winogradskyella pacifica]
MSVLMFHSIGCENENWYRNWLSVSLDHFENFCKFLVKENYETVFLEEWYNNTPNSNDNSSKQVVLTFDDGYLDNWVYAYPILKKYNLKGTIFINPEFIDGSNKVRNNLNDVWDKKIKKNQLSPLGFLNWAEIKKLDKSGVIDIQSHSMSHNFYFKSNKIKDIYTGQPHYDWMPWINRPDRKPYYNIEDQEKYVPKGSPIFEFDRALGLRRYFPDDELIKYASEIYSDIKDKKDKTIFINKLNKKLSAYSGTYESDEDMDKRYRYELFESKNILEEKLNKKVEYLCWPGGGYNELSVELSIAAGYKASTFSTKNKDLIKTDYGDYKNIKRHAMTSFISTSTKNHYIKSTNFLINLFKYHQGKSLNKNLYRANKLGLMILDKIIK